MDRFAMFVGLAVLKFMVMTIVGGDSQGNETLTMHLGIKAHPGTEVSLSFNGKVIEKNVSSSNSTGKEITKTLNPLRSNDSGDYQHAITFDNGKTLKIFWRLTFNDTNTQGMKYYITLQNRSDSPYKDDKDLDDEEVHYKNTSTDCYVMTETLKCIQPETMSSLKCGGESPNTDVSCFNCTPNIVATTTLGSLLAIAVTIVIAIVVIKRKSIWSRCCPRDNGGGHGGEDDEML